MSDIKEGMRRLNEAASRWVFILTIITLLTLALAYTQGGFGALFAAFLTAILGYLIGAFSLIGALSK